MTCKACEEAHTAELPFYFKLGEGRILLIGCSTHVKQLIDATKGIQPKPAQPVVEEKPKVSIQPVVGDTERIGKRVPIHQAGGSDGEPTSLLDKIKKSQK